MPRRSRLDAARYGGFSARTGAARGLTRPRFDFYCTSCGHSTTASIAPEACPACHGSVWEHRRSRTPFSSRDPEQAPSIAALADKVIGSDRVRRWRFEQLQRAGYPVGEAFALSGFGHVDLHRAVRLVQARCPVSLAMQILV